MEFEDLRIRVKRLEDDQEAIQKAVGKLQDTTLSTEERHKIEDMCKLIFGDEKLRILPLPQMVHEMYQDRDRFRWLMGVLGVTGLGTLITLILLIKEVFGV